MRKFDGYKRGINLGGWLSQCGAGNYTTAHYDEYITEKDIEKIAAMGADHVRLPVDCHLFQNENFSFIEEGLQYIDSCIEWCGRHGLKMVLDLHKTIGFIFDDKAYCKFFYEQDLQDNFVSVWEMLTRRYGKYSDRVAFELLNEVTAREFAEKWNEIAARTIEAIRRINTDVKIIIGGIYNSSIDGLALLDKPADENIVFTFHCYSPMIFTHQSAGWVENMPTDLKVSYPDTVAALHAKTKSVFGSDFDGEFEDSNKLVGSAFFERLFAKAMAVSERYDVPLYCGEYGVIDYADPQNTAEWFRDIHSALEKFEIPRAVWTYKSMSFGITDEHYSPVINEIAALL